MDVLWPNSFVSLSIIRCESMFAKETAEIYAIGQIARFAGILLQFMYVYHGNLRFAEIL